MTVTSHPTLMKTRHHIKITEKELLEFPKLPITHQEPTAKKINEPEEIERISQKYFHDVSK